jgi:hypothetical protein
LYKRSFYVILAVFLMVLLGVTVMAENHSTESNSTAQLTVFTDPNAAKTITSVDIPPAGKSLGDATILMEHCVLQMQPMDQSLENYSAARRLSK